MSENVTKKYSPRDIFSRFYRLISYSPKYVLISFIGAVLSAVTRFGLQYFNGLISSIATQYAMDKKSVWGAMLTVAIGVLLVNLPNMPGFYYNAYGSYKLGGKIKLDLLGRYLRKKERDAINEHSGDFMNRLTNNCSTLEHFFGQGSSFGIIAPIVTGIAAIITVWVVNYRFVILLLAIGMISAFVSLLFSKATHKWAQQETKTSQYNTEMLSSILNGTLQIKNLGIGEQILSDLSGRLDMENQAARRLENLQKAVQFFKQFFEAAGVVGCLLLASFLSERGMMQFSSVMLVLSMQSIISNMLAAFGEIWNKLISFDAHVERIFEALDIEVEQGREELPDLAPQKDSPVIEYKNVDFSYTDGRPVLKNLSLEIKEGSRVGITGTSGGGKSTIFGLALNYFEPDSGEVRLFGVKAEECSLASWRRQTALVQQDSPMMDLSIGENIALGKRADGTVTQFEIEEAAKAAGAHDFIMSLPDGYNTMAGEHGGMLSGGQRQRIAIARAFLAGAPLILLDEPTSALDAENERLVTQALENISKKRTVIVIAHRLNTIKNFNEILILDKGSIAERGKHEELIHKGGVYANLWRIGNSV